MTLRYELREPQANIAEPLSPQESETLAAVSDLFTALNQSDIRYCHWKSNVRLEAALAGDTDLDLLVDPAHEDEFKRLLGARDIKLVVPPPGKEYPGLEHYLGFDYLTGRLFHLHVHFRLVLGEQYVKNYALPLEAQFLDSSGVRCGVKVPSPEMELIVLSLRALLKYRDRDALKDLLSIRSPGIPAHIRSEVLWLLAQTAIGRVEEILCTLPMLEKPETILEFIQTMQQAPRDGGRLFRLRARARAMLRPYQRRARLLASLAYFKALMRKMTRGRATPERQMTLPNRGPTVALIGVDGSGKSTLSAELAQWLSWRVETRLYYLGSKQPSFLTRWSYIFFRACRRGNREISAVLGPDYWVARWIAAVGETFLAFHYLSVGRDRYGRYRRAQVEAANGRVIIFDRFPFAAPLDGPEIHLLGDGSLNLASRYMSRAERDLYRQLDPVDLLILLEVSPKTSLRRKPDHALETLRAKNAAVEKVRARLAREAASWNWITVDTEVPIGETLLTIKRAIWAAL